MKISKEVYHNHYTGVYMTCQMWLSDQDCIKLNDPNFTCILNGKEWSIVSWECVVNRNEPVTVTWKLVNNKSLFEMIGNNRIDDLDFSPGRAAQNTEQPKANI